MTEILVKEDIEIGNEISVLALCSHVEVLQNLSTVGSYREVYYLHGQEGAYLSGIIFKNFGANEVDTEMYHDVPVLVTGTVSEYRGVKQLNIKTITSIADNIHKDELLAEMVDTAILSELNDIVWSTPTMFSFAFEHLKPALGLQDSTAGTLVNRLLRFLQIGIYHYPEFTTKYVENISLLTDYYLKEKGTFDSKLDVLKTNDCTLIRALLFNIKDYPEYEEFVKLHHLIIKPRGCVLEILDNSFGNNSIGGSNIH